MKRLLLAKQEKKLENQMQLIISRKILTTVQTVKGII